MDCACNIQRHFIKKLRSIKCKRFIWSLVLQCAPLSFFAKPIWLSTKSWGRSVRIEIPSLHISQKITAITCSETCPEGCQRWRCAEGWRAGCTSENPWDLGNASNRVFGELRRCVLRWHHRLEVRRTAVQWGCSSFRGQRYTPKGAARRKEKPVLRLERNWTVTVLKIKFIPCEQMTGRNCKKAYSKI